ncbi:unnamed protein product [Adineta ricciae]|uniref:Uncharacterized protein n=1 Tax=Adineta ricciae TaxID=249248 RepID=A0A815VDN3_ADIRI|nr:unnamed protein product [Adineta ricciae]
MGNIATQLRNKMVHYIKPTLSKRAARDEYLYALNGEEKFSKLTALIQTYNPSLTIYDVARSIIALTKERGEKVHDEQPLSSDQIDYIAAEFISNTDEYLGEQATTVIFFLNATKVTSAVIEGSPRLKLIGRGETRTDNIDTDTATRHGILVMNTPGGNILSTAEHTCALICSLTIGYDPIIPAEQSLTFGVEFFELKDLWSLADHITVHVPLMQGTHHLINEEVLLQCRKSVKLVNVARGDGIIDETALLDALNSGHCSGAALDVFEEPPTDLKLIQHPGVIRTPHLGANTRVAQKRVAIELPQQIIDFKRGHSLIGVVNGTVVTSQFGQGNRLILLLSKRLGKIIGVSSTSTPNHISLSFNHTVSSHLFEALSIYFSYGYLYEQGNKRVNFVNARHLFEAKMDMVVDKSQELNNVLVVRVTGDSEIKELSGIVSGDHLWLSGVNQCRFTAHVPFDDEKTHIVVQPIKGSSS